MDPRQMVRTRFTDRSEAGRVLAGALAHYADRPDVVVLGLPRGGVVVAHEVARALHLPMDVFVVRKLGVPGCEELAMGAIASGGVRIIEQDTVRRLGIDQETIDGVVEQEAAELQRRESLYRAGRPPTDVRARTVLLVDDGLATGASMRAAVTALRRADPGRIVVAVPVGASSTCEEMRALADEVVCASTPEPFFGVGMWYTEFGQTSDQEVQRLLDRASDLIPAASHHAHHTQA